MRTMAAMGAAGLVSAFLAGCQSVMPGAYVPDPKLSARDLQMMALAPPSESSIPIYRVEIGDPI